jgi:hypothetical protein
MDWLNTFAKLLPADKGVRVMVFDMDSIKKQATTVGAIFAVDIVSLVLFGAVLG